MVAVVKEEAKGKTLDSGIFLIPLSPLLLFLSYLVLGGEARGDKGWEKKSPQSSKERLGVVSNVNHNKEKNRKFDFKCHGGNVR